MFPRNIFQFGDVIHTARWNAINATQFTPSVVNRRYKARPFFVLVGEVANCMNKLVSRVCVLVPIRISGVTIAPVDLNPFH